MMSNESQFNRELVRRFLSLSFVLSMGILATGLIGVGMATLLERQIQNLDKTAIKKSLTLHEVNLNLKDLSSRLVKLESASGIMRAKPTGEARKTMARIDELIGKRTLKLGDTKYDQSLRTRRKKWRLLKDQIERQLIVDSNSDDLDFTTENYEIEQFIFSITVINESINVEVQGQLLETQRDSRKFRIFLGLVTFLLLAFGAVFTRILLKRIANLFVLISDQGSRLQTLGEIGGVIAHEINTPIGIVLMTSDRITDMLNAEEPDKAGLLKAIEKIHRTARRVTKIVESVKSLSRNATSDPMEPINVNSIVREARELSRAALKRQGLDLDVIDSTKGAVLNCRQSEILQVLLNLIGNAGDAAVPTKKPWVRLEVNALPDSMLEFRVIDSGRGISPDIQEEIFQPYFTTKDVGKGTGYGLAVSVRIIKRHSGQIFLDQEHINTCFVVQLPMTLEKSEDEREAA